MKSKEVLNRVCDMLRDRVETLEKSRDHVKGDPTDYAKYALTCAIHEIEAGGYPRPSNIFRSDELKGE